MRTKDGLLDDFENMKLFCQYLYLDENNRIRYFNVMTTLEIRMNDNYSFKAKNLKFPDIPEMHFDENMSPGNILGIIDVLKEQPAEEYPDRFSNRWDEVKTITQMQTSLNYLQK